MIADCLWYVNYFLAAARQMNLAELVRLRMAQLDIKAVEVEKRSNKAVTDTHIATILAGKAHNPTLKVLLGLARALEVDPVEVFKAAASVDEPEDSWTSQTLIKAIQQMLFLKPAEIRRIKKMLKID
jgi:transcriptional regulator with XRE-family HTH domain